MVGEGLELCRGWGLAWGKGGEAEAGPEVGPEEGRGGNRNVYGGKWPKIL